MPKRIRPFFLSSLLALPLMAAACSIVPAAGGADLAATLAFRDEPGGPVAFQSGQPVPTFDWQPRLRYDLDGTWRFDPEPLDTDLSLADRATSMQSIDAELGARAKPTFDDSKWATIPVPGSFDQPPNGTSSGGFYRLDFPLPADWSGEYASLKFGAVRYVSDVWLNNRYLGYHEGGDTPFSLDATQALLPGATNTLLVRVDNPPWGTRDDVVPWGLADWWNYGGIVGDVWLEATPSFSTVRADVTPHLDAADVWIVLQHRGPGSVEAAGADVRLWPAQVTAADLLNPDPFSLVPADATPLLDHHIDLGAVSGDSVFRVAAPFTIRAPDLWTPSVPALYVLDVTVDANGKPVDDYVTSFGLRQIKVDSTAPRILLNGAPIAFDGVALHEERQQPSQHGDPAGGPITSAAGIAALLMRARNVHADLVRVDHHPPNQMLPVIADRLGLALWEEIPLYHFTPQTFSITMGRGIPQQMLAEMDLRDFNRPSVLFHGLANESTGGPERIAALDTLRSLDRRIDGTRLVAQAAYGSDPADPTSAGLDVAGYTLYSGVLYGGRLSGLAVQTALMEAHRTYPKKPLMIMEFGHWSNDQSDQAQQQRVFNTYYSQLTSHLDTAPGGFVAASVWWSLDDYWTQRPGITVETFGLYRPDGSLRPAGVSASRSFALDAPATPVAQVRSEGVAVAIQQSPRHGMLLAYVAYGLAVPAAFLTLAIALMAGRRRPAW